MKNYVKKYKDYQVPEGATHFSFESKHEHAAFWGPDCMWVVFDGNAEEYKADSIPKDAIELPEAPQEWVPEVGQECDGFVRGLSGEYAYEKVIPLFYFNEGSEFAVQVSKTSHLTYCDQFKPPKTQQEKDREAFIARCVSLTELDGSMAVEGFGIAYDDGARFTAPKAGE